MTFAEQLDHVITTLGCTNKQLSEASGLGAGTISRYRNGERTPQPGSEQFEKLVKGLTYLSDRMGGTFAEKELKVMFERSITPATETACLEYNVFIQNLNKLLKRMEVKSVDLARTLHSDPSWISRILSGQRQPSDPQKFTWDIAEYIAGRFYDSHAQLQLMTLIGTAQAPVSRQELQEQIVHWLGSSPVEQAASPIHTFLGKLDDFDLNAFMRQIHFQEMKVPSLPFQFPGAKNYYGIEQMKQAEIDFLKATVTSKSMEDVICYSDMPLLQMAQDEEFKKKWMYGNALMLRKGLHLHIIHDVHRPFKEMLFGLENWIPMYMTGQISPYYFKEPANNTFLHYMRSSGSAALFGDAIAGKQENGRFTLSHTKEDITYIRRRAKDMLSCAKPLMRIYRKESEEDFRERLQKSRRINSVYRLLGSAPPIFTMSEELLRRILKRNHVSASDTDKVLACRKNQLKQVTEADITYTRSIELPKLTEDELLEHPVRLSVSELFLDQDICYSPDEYKLHIKQTQEFVKTHKQFQLRSDPDFVFRNIRITICEKNYVVVSKCNPPAIHFVIYHPKMIAAFEEFNT